MAAANPQSSTQGISDEAGHEHTDRSEYWLNYRPKADRGRPKKFKYREPLILCGHGVRIRLDHNSLLIRNGFTHYPQKVQEIRFFPGDSNLPDRIVILDGNGGISFDALAWMAKQEISLVQLDWRGDIVTIGSTKLFNAKPELVAAQQNVKNSPRRAATACWLIRQKLNASFETIQRVFPNGDAKKTVLAEIQKSQTDLNKPAIAKSIDRIFGVEGRTAFAYFRAWKGIEIKWASSRAPIPPAWHTIGARNMNWKRSHHINAGHPINAMLNYSYAIMKSAVRAQVMATGLDPAIGIMHGNRHNRMPLVSDLMEPLRPVVDRSVLEFALSHTFHPGDFTINRLGGCRLNPQMAKMVVGQVVAIEAGSVVKGFLEIL